MNFSMKSVKIHKGLSQETLAFTAKVYLDGKYVADAQNAGHGGPTDILWHSKDARKQFQEWVKTLPPIVSDIELAPGKFFEYKQDEDNFFSELVNKYELKQTLDRAVKRGKTIFRFKGSKQGEWREIKAPPSYVRDQYAGEIEVIYNDNPLAALGLTA